MQFYSGLLMHLLSGVDSQSERSEIRCFPGPMNVSFLVSVGRQLDRDWHSVNIL
jgi:hypothetical protein